MRTAVSLKPRREHGSNATAVKQLIADKPAPAWKKFLAQFHALVILLLIATTISTRLWFYEREAALPYGAITIIAVVLLNALIGYIQKSRAESALAALRSDFRSPSLIRSGPVVIPLRLLRYEDY